MGAPYESPWVFARPLFDGAEVPFWAIDRDKRLVFGNQRFTNAWFDAFGERAAPGMPVVDMMRPYYPELAQRYEVLYDRALAGEHLADIQEQFPVQGTTQHLMVSMFPVHVDGNVVGVSCLGADVTPLERARRELAQAKKLFSKAFHLAPIAMIITEAESGRVLDVNEAFTATSGYTRQEALGRTTVEVGIWPSVEARTAIMQRLAYGPIRNVELHLRKKSGELAWALTSFTRTELDGRDCVLAVAEDVTQRRKTEDALRQSEERFRHVFQVSPVPIIVSTPEEGEILDANQAFAEMFGYTREELLGRKTTDLNLWADQAQREALVRRIRTDERVLNQDIDFRKKSGQVGHALGGFVRTILEGRQVMVAVAEDITARKKWEERRGQAAKMEAIGQLAAGVAHDFNNLLTVILGATELLLDRRLKGRAEHDALQRVHGAAVRAAQLTAQLLTFGRKQPTRPKRIEPNAEIRDLGRMLVRTLGEDVQLEFELTSEPLPICMDRSQLQQVLLDLALNARDAMPDGGRLTFRTHTAEPLDGDGAAELPVKRYAVIEVQDTGTGMSSEVKSHLFEPFFTTKPQGKGLGLGLSTVYGIVHQSGGRIHVESAPGRGTTFRLYLPLAGVQERRPSAEPLPLQGP